MRIVPGDDFRAPYVAVYEGDDRLILVGDASRVEELARDLLSVLPRLRVAIAGWKRAGPPGYE